MKASSFFLSVVIGLLVLAACDGVPGEASLPPTVPAQMQADIHALQANETAQAEYAQSQSARRRATEMALDSQRTLVAHQVRVTEAAQNAQMAAAQVTAQANQTREAIGATITRQMLNEQATRAAQSIQATVTQQGANMTATHTAAQYTATANAQSAAATQTIQTLSVQATQVSASATATAQAFSVSATRVSAAATATVTMAQVITAQEKAEWERKLEAARALAWFGGIVLGIVALLIFLGFLAYRVIDALVLRARVIRDATGVPFVLLPPDRKGRQLLLAPTRQPGAVTVLTPPGEEPMRIEAGAMDGDTTKRDQAVSLLFAAKSGSGSATAHLRAFEEPRVRVVEAPPPHLVSPEARQVIEQEWRQLKESNPDTSSQ